MTTATIRKKHSLYRGDWWVKCPICKSRVDLEYDALESVVCPECYEEITLKELKDREEW